jgi:protein SCO1/2
MSSLKQFGRFIALTAGLMFVLSNLLPLEAQSRYRRSAPEGFGQGVHQAPENMDDIQIVDRLGETVDHRNIRLTDENGEERELSYYFDQGKPVLISMVYFNCPSLCGLVLNGVKNATRRLDWTPGREYIHLTVSIDPEEGAELAAAKKNNFIHEFGRPEAARGWHFLTGQEDQLRLLASQLGFGYRYIEKTQEYAHGAGIFILTPDGVVSRVLYGVEYDPKDLRLALLEASHGTVGSIMDKILLFCYRYDPESGGYALYAMQLMRAGGGVTLALVFGYLAFAWRRERRQLRKKG